MTTDSDEPAKPPVELATYLFARREALLNLWRTACEADVTIPNTANLSREEFNDQVPVVLDLFDQQLRGQPLAHDLSYLASEHGLHRWHKGYSLRALLAELSHLYQCLAAEVTAYSHHYPNAEPAVLHKAYESIVRFSSLLTSGSVTRYAELQREQAAGRAEALQLTLNRVQELTRQRSAILRTATHDLRGGFGIIQGAASLLTKPNATDEEQAGRLSMLQRNLLSISDMLSQLTDLARLEAGQETVHSDTFNASELLRSTVQSIEPLAHERGLFVQADGPEELIVQTDRILVQRIIQNLLLNAIKYTPSGFVSVSWSAIDSHHWIIGIQDTGPGLPKSLASSLLEPLKPTVEFSSVLQNTVQPASATSEDIEPVAPPKTHTDQSAGEGIGLYVVKRLCELLRANLDIETQPNRGTLFRLRLATHHEN
ncbi:sensor histidine kinase [Fibrisoma montanum]|uniref:histidine kinase n=1 Tax=Fibrisoma montanum TaxID=2305895 RepID=A0A418MH56_9BACT|nr:HAMP domain-containing sensor histidine kinase [Fibrisoma montanum]RIV26760.1 sensor histidine kinase [Fibrisoma montanum]